MSERPWTPGPWTAFQRDGEKGTNYFRLLLHSHPEQQNIYGQDSLAGYCGEHNATLAAASPELYEVVAEAVHDRYAQLCTEIDLSERRAIKKQLARWEAALDKAWPGRPK